MRYILAIVSIVLLVAACLSAHAGDIRDYEFSLTTGTNPAAAYTGTYTVAQSGHLDMIGVDCVTAGASGTVSVAWSMGEVGLSYTNLGSATGLMLDHRFFPIADNNVEPIGLRRGDQLRAIVAAPLTSNSVWRFIVRESVESE